MTTGADNADLTTEEQLRALLGSPGAAAVVKERDRLHELDRQWLAASPYYLMATSDADGSCDVSPKGDPPGSVLVLDDETIALPERPGNRRLDGMCNLLTNPHVGLMFLLPGRGDTLRVNGRARLVQDADLLDRMTLRNHRPVLAIVVHVEQVFHHCSRAALRSGLWDPAGWQPDAVASRAQMCHTFERPGQSLAEIEAYYGSPGSTRLYGEPSR